MKTLSLVPECPQAGERRSLSYQLPGLPEANKGRAIIYQRSDVNWKNISCCRSDNKQEVGQFLNFNVLYPLFGFKLAVNGENF